MGHNITDKGIKIDDEKIKAINNMTAPQDFKQLKSFLGMINYLSKFIPNLPDKTKLLR